VLGKKLLMQRIHVIDHEVNYAARDAVSAVRRQIDPRTIARQVQIARIFLYFIGSVSIFEPKTEPAAIELHSRGYV
jgi:hypothetical protein